MTEDLVESLRQGLLCLLEETLHSHQGVYLSPGTSLLETVANIDANLASRRYPGLDQTIAGHLDHARYYLANTYDLLRGQGTGDFDTAESWKTGTVKAEEWESLKAKLSDTYQRVMGHISTMAPSDLQASLSAVLGLFAHSAYHLGAIRQLKDLTP